MPDAGLRSAVAVMLGLGAAPAAADSCAMAPYRLVEDPALAALLTRMDADLARYRSLADAMAAVAPTICLSADPSEALGFFEPEANRVVIDAGLPFALQRAILFHELRHVEQYARGLCPDLSLSMREYARATWALEADATTISLIVAWDLRGSGDPGPWTALAAHPRQADLAVVFTDVMEATGDVRQAGAAVFEGWYESAERRVDYYVASCSAYLDQLDRTHVLPRYGAIDEDFLEMLCVMPDGTPFPCAEPD